LGELDRLVGGLDATGQEKVDDGSANGWVHGWKESDDKGVKPLSVQIVKSSKELTVIRFFPS